MNDKFCVNCRHYVPAIGGLDPVEYAKCAFRFAEVDPVLGLPRTQPLIYCASLRVSVQKDTCGAAAQFYEAKEPEAVAA